MFLFGIPWNFLTCFIWYLKPNILFYLDICRPEQHEEKNSYMSSMAIIYCQYVIIINILRTPDDKVSTRMGSLIALLFCIHWENILQSYPDVLSHHLSCNFCDYLITLDQSFIIIKSIQLPNMHTCNDDVGRRRRAKGCWTLVSAW